MRPLRRHDGANRNGAFPFIGAQRRAAENFGELAADEAAQQVHLEETVRAFDVTLSEEEIAVVAGENVRHAAIVA